MSLDADTIVDRRRMRRKLTFWRACEILLVIVAVVAVISIVNAVPPRKVITKPPVVPSVVNRLAG